MFSAATWSRSLSNCVTLGLQVALSKSFRKKTLPQALSEENTSAPPSKTTEALSKEAATEKGRFTVSDQSLIMSLLDSIFQRFFFLLKKKKKKKEKHDGAADFCLITHSFY